MCGRYVAKEPIETIAKAAGLSVDDASLQRIAGEPRYNIAPSQEILGVRNGGNGREGAVFHWGLVPHWAKDKKVGYRMINARSETVWQKRSFANAIRKRRCLIPASGFYEWRRTGGPKQPFFIHRKDGEVMFFAGIWEFWEKEGESVESAAILTTGPNKVMEPLHDRMPVILTQSELDAWLSGEAGKEDLEILLKPCDDALLEAFPVSTQVNNARNQGAELIDELETV